MILLCVASRRYLCRFRTSWNISKWPEVATTCCNEANQLCSQGTHQIAPVRLLGSSLGDSTKDWPIDPSNSLSMLLQWPKSAISIWSIQLVGLLWVVAASCQATIAIHSPAAWEESQTNCDEAEPKNLGIWRVWAPENLIDVILRQLRRKGWGHGEKENPKWKTVDLPKF